MTVTATARQKSAGRSLGQQARALLDRPNAPYLIILGSAALLIVLGLVMTLSASSVDSMRATGSSFSLWRKQAVFFAVGVPVLFACSRLPVRVWRALAYPSLILSGVLLAMVQVMGAKAVNGNRNWILVGGVQIQPSEAAKLALVLWGADLLARKHKLLGQWKHLLVPLLPVSVFILLLVLIGNDLGTAMVLMLLVLSLLFFAGAPFSLFAVVLAVGGAGAGMLAATKSNRVARLTSWISPNADPTFAYQALHGRFALGTGGFLGVGLGASREKWGNLPEAHNDFIFAIIGEELGLLGSLVVVGLFGALCYGGFQVALRSTGRFEHLAAAAVTTWLAAQTVINIGAVIGMMPVIGLPLPLVSAGGSALLSTMAAIGLLLSLARTNARRELAELRERAMAAPDHLRVPPSSPSTPRASGSAAGRRHPADVGAGV